MELPYDPIKLSEEVEAIVIDGNKRKYNTFRLEPFYGQIATARAVGCNLRCSFCWINPSRDNPKNYGAFYSPQEVYEKLIEVSSNKFGRATMSGVTRITGCEPTIGKNHLLSVAEISKEEEDFRRFLIETNGILLGSDENYVKTLSKFGDYIRVRLSFKAGTPEAFERKTGAEAKFFDLQFKALEYLKKHNVSYSLAAMSKDPAIMPDKERRSLLTRIIEYGPGNLNLLEEEKADPFGITKKRLVESGIVARAEDIRQYVYESLDASLMRFFEGRKSISLGELKEAIQTMDIKIVESSCRTCKRHNPWHGYKVMDDLDTKLI